MLPWCAQPPVRPRVARPFTGRPRLRDVVARLGPRRAVAAGAAVLAVVIALGLAVGAVTAGGPTVTTPFLTYTAPAGWTAEPPGGAGPLDGPTLTGAVRGPGYDCGGETHVRGFAAAALLPVDPAGAAGPAGAAERLARWFAATAYAAGDGTAPEVTVAPARPVRVDGAAGPVDGAVVEAAVRAPARGDCPATAGTVLVLAAPAGGGTATLLAAGDTAGGPADPGPVDRAALDALVAGVRLAPG